MPVDRGLLIALVGADGAGKSTVTALVSERLQVPSSQAYLGDEPPAGVPVLLTTRWLRRRWSKREDTRAGGVQQDQVEVGSMAVAAPRKSRLRRSLAQTATGLNAMAEEWHQVRRAQRRVRAGDVVLLDRHFYYDYYFHHVAVRPPALVDRMHGRWLSWVLPRPDVVICLDASPEVLYARQPEGTFEQRVVRRLEYLRMADAVQLQVIDASQPLEEVVEAVIRLVMSARKRQGDP